ncbi:MAG: mitofilin family membrane protein [Rhodospirillaceae bacterium]|nr:mitofilin family membrane protein [Rhodospirillaceae bacterium]
MNSEKENTKDNSDSEKEKKSSLPPADPTPTSSGGLIWLVVFLAVIGVGGWAFWPEIGPTIKPIIAKVRGISKPEDFVVAAPNMADIQAEENKTETQIQNLPTQETVTQETVVQEKLAPIIPNNETPIGDQANIASALASIQQKLSTIEQRLNDLESRPQITRDPTSSAQALVLATTQLAARLSGEVPFVAELDVLEKVAGNEPQVMQAISKLKPHAEAGIPTVATLSARFKNLAKDIARARLRGSDSGWMGEIKDRLGNLVVVRRTDPTTTTDPVERALALAEAALDVGALDEAVDAMKALEGNAGALAAPWLGDSDARLMAALALETLNNHALARLGAATD